MATAIAEPFRMDQNIQGGNVVMVHLNAGESVWVSSCNAESTIE
jgi:hypothetical protein